MPNPSIILSERGMVRSDTVKINGADPDFHRRDLYEAIAKGAFPEWEFGVQAARGSGAHGYFEVTNPIPHLTRTIRPTTATRSTSSLKRSRLRSIPAI
jgi:catalase